MKIDDLGHVDNQVHPCDISFEICSIAYKDNINYRILYRFAVHNKTKGKTKIRKNIKNEDRKTYISTLVHNKRDDLFFPIVNFPLLNGDVTLASYGVCTSQLVRFALHCVFMITYLTSMTIISL